MEVVYSDEKKEVFMIIGLFFLLWGLGGDRVSVDRELITPPKFFISKGSSMKEDTRGYTQIPGEIVFSHDMERDNPALIRLKIAKFDPLQKVPDFSDKGLEGKSDMGEYGYYLVQFQGSIREAWRDALLRKGAIIYGYIPNHAYLIRIDNSKLKLMKEELPIRWIGDYKPAYRISPKLLEPQEPEIPYDEPGTIQMLIQVFKEEDFNKVIEKVKNLNVDILRMEKGYSANYIRIKVDVNRSKDIAISIANIPEVRWVERFYIPHLFHAWTRWINQSSATSGMGSATSGWNACLSVSSTLTPIYAHGIFGQGEIVGDADTGIDWDNPWWYETSSDMNFNSSGTNFTGTPGTKIVGYQTLSDDHDGASNGSDNYGRGPSGHGTHTSTTICGDSLWHDPSSDGILARGDGIAPMARMAFQDISTTPGNNQSEGLDGLPSDLNDLFLWAYNAGARIHSDSWGSSNSDYDTYASQTDEFMWNHKDFLAFIAMGNSGPNSGTIGSPATAKNCVSVGSHQSGGGCNVPATGQESTVWQNPGDPEDRYGTSWNSDGIPDDDFETMSWFSSHGPTDEGLRKPEIVTAGGHMTYSGWSTGSTSDGPWADPPSPNSDATSNGTYLCQMGGTSMATPAAAGFCALVRQYYREGWYPTGTKQTSDAFVPSGALMKATMIAATRNMTGYYTSDNGSASVHADVPTNGQGWGRVVLDDALYFDGDTRKLYVKDYTTGLSNGQTWDTTITLGSSTTEDFKVVLVWTDYYGTQSSTDPLVNDLNLEVVVNGNTYLGSVFSGGYSTTGGSADNKNANEVVWLRGSDVANQDVTIRVIGYDINYGPQPFALVIVGDIYSGNGRPDAPTLHLPFDNEILPDVQPTFRFTSTDPEGDDIRYEVDIGENSTFTSGEFTEQTNLYSSGSEATYTLSNTLQDGKTYWYRVRAIDPNGSGAWSSWSEVRSFTVNTGVTMPYWYQTRGEQFTEGTGSGTVISGDTLKLAHSFTQWSTDIDEDFDDGSAPGWAVSMGDADTATDDRYWVIGTTSDLSSYTPPNYGTYYAFYSDDDAGSGDTDDDKRLWSPAVYVGDAESLKITYGWGYQDYQGEWYGFYAFFFRNGSWGSSSAYWSISGTDGSGTQTIDLTDSLNTAGGRADSALFMWRYMDTENSSWGWASAVDNVLCDVKHSVNNDQGSYTTSTIVYQELDDAYPSRTNWSYLHFTKTDPNDSVMVQVEYLNGGSWSLVPDAALSAGTNTSGSNSAGFFTTGQVGEIDLTGMNPSTYDSIRVNVSMFRGSGKASVNPGILDIAVGDPAPLGIMITSFVARIGGDGIYLTWNAYPTSDVVSYVIERDGARIAELPAGNSGTYSYIDRFYSTGVVVYRVFVKLENGDLVKGGEVEVNADNIPLTYKLYPINTPRNSVLVVTFSVPEEVFVKINIFDITGRNVVSLLNEKMRRGIHRLIWKAGNKVGSGIYFVKMESGKYRDVRKVLLLK